VDNWGEIDQSKWIEAEFEASDCAWVAAKDTK
jgi:hypothetical protein